MRSGRTEEQQWNDARYKDSLLVDMLKDLEVDLKEAIKNNPGSSKHKEISEQIKIVTDLLITHINHYS